VAIGGSSSIIENLKHIIEDSLECPVKEFDSLKAIDEYVVTREYLDDEIPLAYAIYFNDYTDDKVDYTLRFNVTQNREESDLYRN
jgi:hypothetical protein